MQHQQNVVQLLTNQLQVLQSVSTVPLESTVKVVHTFQTVMKDTIAQEDPHTPLLTLTPIKQPWEVFALLSTIALRVLHSHLCASMVTFKERQVAQSVMSAHLDILARQVFKKDVLNIRFACKVRLSTTPTQRLVQVVITQIKVTQESELIMTVLLALQPSSVKLQELSMIAHLVMFASPKLTAILLTLRRKLSLAHLVTIVMKVQLHLSFAQSVLSLMTLPLNSFLSALFVSPENTVITTAESHKAAHLDITAQLLVRHQLHAPREPTSLLST